MTGIRGKITWDSIQEFGKSPWSGFVVAILGAVISLALAGGAWKGPLVGALVLIGGLAWNWYQASLHYRSELETKQGVLIDELHKAREFVESQVRGIRTAMYQKIGVEPFDNVNDAITHLANHLPTATAVTLLIGRQHAERNEHLKAIARVVETTESRTFCCRVLKGDGPQIDFITLEDGRCKEVLWGWAQEKVLSSKNKNVVRLFSDFERTLDAHSEKMKPEELRDWLTNKSRCPQGLKQFWFPYFQNHIPTTVIYTQPVFFRIFLDEKHRFFLRDIDINDGETSFNEGALRNNLKSQMSDWGSLSKVEPAISRAYLPGGEAFALENVLRYLQECGEYLRQRCFINQVYECKPQAYNEARWIHISGEHKPPVSELNLVVLGNLRANPKAKGLLRGFRYQLGDHGITIDSPTSDECDILAPYIKAYINSKGEKTTTKPNEETISKLELREDWSTESMVLVTRGPNSGKAIATSILANQGQGVHAVVQTYLTSKTEEEWKSLVDKFGLPKPPESIPPKLQMLFRVVLGTHECHWENCESLVCDFGRDSASQPATHATH